MMPEILRIREPIAETPGGLVYAFGGELEPSVRSQIEVTERDLHSELIQNVIGPKIRGRRRNGYCGKQGDHGCSTGSGPRTASK
jgi:hypothetical protein